MTESAHRPVSRVSAVVGVLLVLSLAANVNLWLARQHARAHADDLAEGYARILSGDMIALGEMLDSAGDQHWDGPGRLWSISATILAAQARAQAVADLKPLLDDDAGDAASRLADLWPDLRDAANAFADAAAKRDAGSPVDTGKLEAFREKVKRAGFPNQDAFTWRSFRAAIDRYKGG